jgi:starch phosphorylase
LGLPIIGIGLLYQQGYFRQYLNADGWQQERYPENDFYTLPLHLERNENGKPKTISIELPGRSVAAQIWKVQVGRIPLYLLDTNIPQNNPEDQNITDQLYGGDKEMRIKQEILLGIGGYRALHALGYSPTVYHINEGHSAFLTLERSYDLMKSQKLSFAEAAEATMSSMVFTTHTPVPAGNDYFTPELMKKHFSFMAEQLGLEFDELLALGRQNPEDEAEHFCMTVLALRMSDFSNGVSKLHGKVSRDLWKKVWEGIPVNELPISSITNGVHAPSWISRDIAGLYDRYLGPTWREDPGHHGMWSRVLHIPDEELWRTHERRRERLVAFARQRLGNQLTARGVPASEIAQAREVLNPDALTIGFARRFATYKRAALLLRNPERLIKILSNKERPMQIIFAGKAHPMDNAGKEIIRQIAHFERNPEVRRRMVFIEDYDMVVARYLVQGVDIWLNTPRRPLEASGTSGMKATLNGALNVSILDGWWDEAYNSGNGWAIGQGEDYAEEKYQDDVESNLLYDLLEKEIVPLYYARGEDDLPRQWIARMKTAMRTIGPEFNSNRMVRQYTEEMYLHAAKREASLSANNFESATSFATWLEHIQEHWEELKIAGVHVDGDDGMKVGDTLTVKTSIELGALSASDISVELYYGQLNAKGEIEEPKTIAMKPVSSSKGKPATFEGAIKLDSSGRMGHTVRVLPLHPDLHNPFRLGLILWA